MSLSKNAARVQNIKNYERDDCWEAFEQSNLILHTKLDTHANKISLSNPKHVNFKVHVKNIIYNILRFIYLGLGNAILYIDW